MDKNIEITGYSGRQIAVPDGWDTVFTHFYYGSNSSESKISKTLMPDFKPLMVFNFGKAMHVGGDHENIIEDVTVTAPLKKVLQYTMAPNSSMLVANFKDDAFYRFFGAAMPPGLLFTHPDKLIGSHCFAVLHEQLQLLTEPEAKINYLLNYAKAFITDSTNFFTDTEDMGYFNPVKVIAQNTGLTERTVQLQYKKQLGYSAKEIARFTRFQKMLSHVNHLPQGEKINWFDLIETFGYYDQSHLIADFKHYIGLSPLNYIKLQQEFCKPGQ